MVLWEASSLCTWARVSGREKTDWRVGSLPTGAACSWRSLSTLFISLSSTVQQPSMDLSSAIASLSDAMQGMEVRRVLAVCTLWQGVRRSCDVVIRYSRRDCSSLSVSVALMGGSSQAFRTAHFRQKERTRA